MTDITTTGCGKKSAVALGFFDGLHLGHIEVIKRALAKDGLCSVVFTFNNNTMLPKFKERQDIISYELKREFLSKIGLDCIFAPDFADLRELCPKEFVDEILVKKLNAGFVACGYDFRFAKGGSADAVDLARLCAERNIEVSVVPAVKINGEPVSSTAIRRLIREGDIKAANELLGYELTYDSEVIRGKQNGRKMGFPTINQVLPWDMVLPKNGVYKSWTILKGHNFPSVTNIGVKPTIALEAGEQRTPLMETHIIGYSGNLYGQRVRVIFREYIREEKRFDSMDKLAEQLERDKRAACSLSDYRRYCSPN